MFLKCILSNLLLLHLINNCGADKILVLFPHYARSHFNIYKLMFEELAHRGHQVTVLSNFRSDKNITNYSEIVLPVSKELMTPGAANLAQKRSESLLRKYVEVSQVHKMTREACEKSLFMKETQDLLKSNATFDLLMIHAFGTDCFLGFVEKFKVPFISLSASGMLPWYNSRFAQPDNPSYIPNILSGSSGEMSFFQRVENLVLHFWTNGLYHYVYSPIDYELAKKAFGDDLKPLEEIGRKASLLFVYSHFLFLPKPLVPSIIDVNGIHVGEPKTLPKNLQEWIDESKHGVIYFSMGSMIKGHTFPIDTLNAMLKVFSELDERIIWKWENKTMANKPDNILISKWAPQFDILCHPNVKLFITHGGLLSTTEALHCGVPVIAIPQYGDQHTNAKFWDFSEAGIALPLSEINEETTRNTLQKALHPKMQNQAKLMSLRYHDRPLPPMETAIYWTEYVLRHKGAAHMKTKAVGMSNYKYLLIDVFLFLSAIIFFIFFLLFCALSFLYRKIKYFIISSSNDMKESKKQN